MSGRKITIIGGGSFLWGPVLARDFLVEPRLEGSELWLHDIAPAPLELVAKYAERVRVAADTGWTVRTTTDPGAALDGADVVVLCISTGGLASMRHDLEIPARYGIAQSVGDTVGPGGLMRALRNVPVVLDIVREMEKRCPGAVLLNLTNPMTPLCRAVTKHADVRTVGVCHEWPNCKLDLRMWLGLGDDDITATIAGINHLIFALDMRIEGRDGFERIREEIAARGMPENMAVKYDVLQKTGALPVAGDRHVAEFFTDYLTPATENGATFGVALTSIADRERWYEEGHTDWEVTGRIPTTRAATTDEPVRLTPSIEDIAVIAADLFDRDGGEHIVNLPNTGQIANLPDGAVVETFAHVSADGIVPKPIGELPAPVRAALEPHIGNHERIVEAALSGDRGLALAAMRDDPLVRDPAAAEPMLDDMLAATVVWLPQFAAPMRT